MSSSATAWAVPSLPTTAARCYATRYCVTDAIYPYYRSLIEREGGIIAGNQSTKTVNNLNLSRIDRYIPVYVTNLLQSYMDAGGDVDEVDATLVEMGVNLDDIIPITGYRRQAKQ